mmetsp:Transcript_2904/g.6059  ORF Transcript_2904/g.6059 Transcript_2904/m.6059 type:complete len:224 (+) Transcript_2904:61-732(+)
MNFVNKNILLFIGLRPSNPAAYVASLSFSMSSSAPRFLTNRMCPYAQKAWIALELSGCDYELEEISLYGPNGKPDSFLQLNPAGTVPVLVCGEDVVTDSEDILDYVSSGHVGRTWTGGEGEESTRWRNIVAEQLAPAGKRAVLGSGRNELFALLEGLDGGVVGPYLCGERPSSADCAAFPFVWRIHDEFGLPDGCAKLGSWLSTCSENPSFRKTVQRSWWWWW